MVAPVTVLGFLAAVVAPLWLAPASLLALAAGWPCRWLVAVGERFGQLTSATVPWPGGVAGGAALVAVLIVVWVSALATGVRRAFVAAAATAIAVLVPVRAATSGWPPTGWFFAACDVGQGDALVLRAGDDAGVLVDAGPDPVPVDRCLHELGIRQLPLVVLTHLHADHIGGLSGAFRGRRVGRIVTGPLAEPATGLRALRSAAEPRALRPAVPVVGSRFAVGAVQLEVLGPRSAYRGTRSDPNNSSLVVRAVVDGVRVLLPGDAEIEAQQDLLRTGVDLHADVLKVAHHGSAYFDPAFLAAVHPAAAVISVGAHNDYGHPSPRLLNALERLGVPTRRTDRDGDVAFAGGPGRLRAVVHGPAASVADGRMAACQPGRSPRTTSPFPCPASCWSWGTRNCSSSERSAPSPRRPAAPTLRWWKPP
jgi:competence protein ComEC